MRVLLGLGAALVAAPSIAQSGTDPIDRTDKFLRQDARPERGLRSKAEIDETKFSARGRRKYAADESGLFIPSYSTRPGGRSYGASLAKSASPRARYFYIDRDTGKPLNARALPTDKPSEIQYFEGDGRWALFSLISITHSQPDGSPGSNRAGGLLSVQVNRDQDRIQVGLNAYGSTTEGGSKFFSPSLDISDSRTLPGFCFTWTTNFNQVWGNGYAAYGWTFDFTVDTSLRVLGRPIGVTTGYTLPSRFGGPYDFFARAGISLGGGKKLRLKWSRDNTITLDCVIRF